MNAPTLSLVDQLTQQFQDVEGVKLEPSDRLLLESFVDEVEAAGGLSMLEEFLNAQPIKLGSLFHY